MMKMKIDHQMFHITFRLNHSFVIVYLMKTSNIPIIVTLKHRRMIHVYMRFGIRKIIQNK